MNSIKEELRNLQVIGQFRQIPEIEYKLDGKVVIDGKEYINFASNDYLGISTKSALRNEFISQNTSLLSSASARLLTGTSNEFKELEKTLSKLFNKEACLIFNSGYQCNLGVISALCQKSDVVFSDRLNHASIIDGMRLSEGDFIRYKHLDYDNLEQILSKKRGNYRRAIIVSESVFSMDGDIADIDKLIELKNKYNCILMIDEAHAFCAFGNDLSGITSGKDVDIITATFGKALGSFGAFCVSNNDIINYLINKSRSFIFSTSVPPFNIAWTNWLLEVNKNYLYEQKSKLAEITQKAHNVLNEYNLSTPSKTHIIPIIIGDNDKTNKVSEKLRAEGFYIPAIRPPTVPSGTSRLRISLTSDINIDDFKRTLEIILSF